MMIRRSRRRIRNGGRSSVRKRVNWFNRESRWIVGRVRVRRDRMMVDVILVRRKRSSETPRGFTMDSWPHIFNFTYSVREMRGGQYAEVGEGQDDEKGEGQHDEEGRV